MTAKVGVIFASSGGYKIIRALRTFARMEPDLGPYHVAIDVTSRTWRDSGYTIFDELNSEEEVEVRCFANTAHINGILNHAMEWMGSKGYTHVALFHDDVVFPPMPNAVSYWLTPELLGKGAITFCHLECFKVSKEEQWARRHPAEWDQIDLESNDLWLQLRMFKRENAYRIEPKNEDWFCHYEGCDKVRKWNRLGPTGQVVPVELWNQVGKFSETNCVHYDQDYPIKLFRMGLPPNYAVPNFPWLHLHNQTMNPWFDPAPGMWGTREAMIAAYGADWPGIWGDRWEQEWKDETPPASCV
jgi:hypothetical protein